MKLRTLMLAGAATAGSLALVRSRTNPRPAPDPQPYDEAKTRILILGGGFGGLYTAKHLAQRLRGKPGVSISVLDRHDYFTFWPMVPEVVSGSIHIQHVLRPLRFELQQAGVNFVRAEVHRIDLDARQVETSVGTLPFDKLVIGLGWQTGYFGVKGAKEQAIPVESLADALRIREGVIERFEEAAAARLKGEQPDPQTLGFVVVGGGSSGVEVAANISELISSLQRLYPASGQAHLTLVQAKDDVLPHMEPSLRNAAAARLKAEHIEVVTDASAAEVDDGGVRLDNGRRLAARTVVWAAGVQPNEVATRVHGGHPDQKGRLRPDPFLRLEGRRDVFVLGDIAAVTSDGTAVAPTAQAAVQEAVCVANNVAAELAGSPLRPFRYRYMGQLVELGGSFAVNQMLGHRISGLLAQLLWRGVYLYKLGDARDRLGVTADWVANLVMPRRVTRLPSHS